MTELANKSVDKASAAQIKEGAGTDKIMTVDEFKTAVSANGLDYPITVDGNVYFGNGGGNLVENVSVGTAMPNNTTGKNNTANGMYALYTNTTGKNNTANGYSALYANTTGSNNTANGNYALYWNTTGGNNTANGYSSLKTNTTGSNNTANGNSALYANTTGSNNTVNGYSALYDNTTGSNNTANGNAALHDNTTGSNNTANGYYAGVAGNYNNSMHLGYNSQATSDNECKIGNNSLVAVRSSATFYGAAFIPTSDKRLKINISPIDKDKAAELSKLVDFVEYDRIQGVVELESEYKRMVSMHESRRDASAEDLSDDLAAIEAELEETHKTYKSKIAAATKEVLRHEAGVIAQELQKVTKKIGAFEWLVKLSDPNDENSILTVDYQSLNSIIHIGYRHRLEKAGI